MKNYALVVCFFCALCTYGQKSIYFSAPLPPASDSIDQVDPQFYGEYLNDDNRMTYIFSDSGIYVRSLKMSCISKDIVREEGKYYVKKGYLFGVTQDSLPCILEKGYYHFGIRSITTLIGGESLNRLKMIDKGEYFINLEEGQNYTPMLLKFKANGLSIQYFDYEPDTKKFDFIEDEHTIKMDNFKLVLLNPTQKEFERMMKFYPFDDQLNFRKVD